MTCEGLRFVCLLRRRGARLAEGAAQVRPREGAQLDVHVQPPFVREGLGARALARPIPKAKAASAPHTAHVHQREGTHTPHSTLVCPSSMYAEPAACEMRPKLMTARRLSAHCLCRKAAKRTRRTGRAQAACVAAVGTRCARLRGRRRRKGRVRFDSAATARLPRGAHLQASARCPARLKLAETTESGAWLVCWSHAQRSPRVRAPYNAVRLS
jgi:hypothetical protein